MAENEQNHRHRQDRSFSTYRFVGLGLGAVVAVGGLLLALYLIKRGEGALAVGAFLGEIAILAALFVTGRYVDRRWLSERNGLNGPNG
jgi:uncharacterized membrane protein